MKVLRSYSFGDGSEPGTTQDLPGLGRRDERCTASVKVVECFLDGKPFCTASRGADCAGSYACI